MSKPKPDFSMEDLVGRLRKAVPDIDDGGATTREIARALGTSHNYVLRRLRELKRSGKLVVVRKAIVKLDDTVSSAPAYKLVQESDDESKESSIGDDVSVTSGLTGSWPGSSATDV